MKVKLTKAQKIKLGNSDAVYAIMREVLLRERLFDRTKEHFWLVCLANDNQLLLIELISFGSSKATIVEPTEVFSFALQKTAKRLIMVHNHPSGDLTPSFSDKEITEKMGAIGKFVNLPIIDHLIISEESYFSFADSGLLEQIMAESHYDLTFEQIDRLKAEMRQAERNAAKKLEELQKKMDQQMKGVVRQLAAAEEKMETVKKEAEDKLSKKMREVARKLLKQGISASQIAISTGLEEKEVENL